MSTPPTRLVHPDPTTNKITNDLYDKLNQNQQVLSSIQQIAKAAVTIQQVQQAIASASASSSSGGKSGPTTIPQVSPLPGTNPALEPLAVDGSLVEFAPSASTPGTLYRFSSANNGWNGPLLGGILSDTFANFANYSAADYPGVFFLQSDRLVLYLSNGTNWIYSTGVFRDVFANRPSLGTHDSGYTFLATDRNSSSYWTGSAWSNFPGTFYPTFRSAGGGTSITATDSTVWLTGAGGVTWNLPAAATTQVFILVNGVSSGGNITVTPAGSDKINGAASYILPQGEAIIIQADGVTDWLILANYNIASGSTTLKLSFRSFAGASDTNLSTDFTVESANSGAATETLLDATTVSGQVFSIKNSVTSTNALTVNTTSAQTIDGFSSFTLQPQESMLVQSDGTNWIVLSIYRIPPTALHATSNGVQLTLTGSYQDIAGATVTLNRAGLWMITGHVDCLLTGSSPAITFQLNAGGAAQSPTSPPIFIAAIANLMASQTWLYQAALNDVAKLQAKSNGGGGFVNSSPASSTITALWIKP